MDVNIGGTPSQFLGYFLHGVGLLRHWKLSPRISVAATVGDGGGQARKSMPLAFQGGRSLDSCQFLPSIFLNLGTTMTMIKRDAVPTAETL